MKCEGCGRNRGIKYKNGVYGISCLEKGEFEIHQDHIDTFNCEDYIEPVLVEEPPKDNIMIVLKCGRDMLLYDKDITCNDDMQRRLHSASENDTWVEFDGMLFNISEIAVLSFIE